VFRITESLLSFGSKTKESKGCFLVIVTSKTKDDFILIEEKL